ncbi:HIT family hydrolase, diadenosine tetraphosphate hydrolase [Thermanaerovibrio velox DSM 12556]|uniref:HIT family hydrolase, diadenosine tetraphosphate hydrolase n=1 Tax=Thermanaerovibrio velox DSM 12556 TaxID=926567 RepID=H0UR59_9BACT|nr:HIT domain-containing protein [Thermanaerovibrio velox]EHM10896.1 HIT family hydrolase, diadenosine tetraphosphate hydrolase [Thermanaerovibrio velox DSM 12556]
MANKDVIFAPWRMAYIKSGGVQDEGCFLCNAAAKGDPLLVHRGDRCLVILNRFPYNPGHLLIAPIRHVGDPEDLDALEASEMWGLQIKCLRVIRKVMNPHGFNVGMNLGATAGAGLPGHLHLHLVPRWNGDCNFMPVIGGVKVIPEALEETRRALVEAWG